MLCLVSFSSCDDDDDYYTGDFLTDYDWELTAVNGMGISEMDVVDYLMRTYGGRYPVLELTDLATGDILTFEPI